MADAKRCDRCGAYYLEDEQPNSVVIVKKKSYFEIERETETDLCGSCFQGLRSYLTGQSEDQHE